MITRKIVKYDSCLGCIFFNGGNSDEENRVKFGVNCDDLKCRDYDRDDFENVIFIEVEEV